MISPDAEAAAQSDSSQNARARRAWLQSNHTRENGVWLITYKKATGKPRIEYAKLQKALSRYKNARQFCRVPPIRETRYFGMDSKREKVRDARKPR